MQKFHPEFITPHGMLSDSHHTFTNNSERKESNSNWQTCAGQDVFDEGIVQFSMTIRTLQPLTNTWGVVFGLALFVYCLFFLRFFILFLSF